jgi:hypothetical protein
MSVAAPTVKITTTAGAGHHRWKIRMTTLAFTGNVPLVRPGITLIRLHDELWRVTRPDGDVLGYVEAFSVRDGVRYRAKRHIVRQGRFIVMGEFWSIDDAIDCFQA